MFISLQPLNLSHLWDPSIIFLRPYICLFRFHTVIIKILFVIHQHSLIWLSELYYDYIFTILLHGLANYDVPYYSKSRNIVQPSPSSLV